MIESPDYMANIPVLDMKGVDFLWFYGISLVGAILWSFGLKARMRSKFSFPGAADQNLTDPYEAAFLAGGEVRCSQVAIMRLLEMNALRISEHPTDKVLWVTGQNAEASLMNPMEWALYQRVEKAGDKGFAVSDAVSTCRGYARPIEARLAKSGLRPTNQERKGVGISSVLPLIILSVIGVMKLFVGLSRGKPVGFLDRLPKIIAERSHKKLVRLFEAY
ncbi:TIGR04222 domain-containing membrane protein [Luteolibacter pohnpeiensis]|uniref:TIGR04222 domain-containing membrane protein n=1 Tax=Luteolibacter pohnpeiensis TaxID=454153 RepID=A0A934VY28_9BACT|nr:TIGR04222 domain-containing membrane protein [Luteolibacter pohnpeiensis]MBK1884453.1 TIGR04222 domain-containing membrane protein [Luteolibacter pohnpeiensis]